MTTSDARKRNAERVTYTLRADTSQIAEAFKRMAEQAEAAAARRAAHAWSIAEAFDQIKARFPKPDQEPDMPAKDRHDELVALLTPIKTSLVTAIDTVEELLGVAHEIRDRLPEPEGVKDEPAPADDLPGEPVEPGDLRAGDRVAFTCMGERITCALVSSRGGAILCSDTPGSGGFTPSVVYRGKWDFGISDVRLERAPREGEGPDEERARHSDDANCEWAQYRKDYGVDPTVATHKAFHAGFKAAREHIEAERESRERTVVDEWDDMLARAEKAEAERDEWKARHEALREDVETRWAFVDDNFLKDILHSILKGDDERAKGADQR